MGGHDALSFEGHVSCGSLCDDNEMSDHVQDLLTGAPCGARVALKTKLMSPCFLHSVLINSILALSILVCLDSSYISRYSLNV